METSNDQNNNIKFKVFAENLKELRAKNKLTQKEFADAVGFTQATLSSYENCLKNPSLDIVYKIADKFKVSIDWLVGLPKREDESIKTCSDVIKLIIELEKKIPLHIDYTLKENDDYYSPDSTANIYINNEDLALFFSEWENLKKLHDDKTIDDELYDLWFEKTLKKYNVPLCKETDPVNKQKLYSDVNDLPF